jgi:predicted enzyme related to lactoylglutathione lyase
MLFATDLDRLARFYADAFGLSRRNTADAGYAEMVDGDAVVLTLHALPPHIAAEVHVSSPPAWRDECAIKVCFATDDVAASRQLIVDHGGQAKDPWSWEGSLFCECTDPEGNVIQVFARPRAVEA